MGGFEYSDSWLDSRGEPEYSVVVVKVPLFSEIKEQEAKQRRIVKAQRGSKTALARQREVSLVGDGAKWRITNLRQVAAAMAKWA
jgi:hypothetical protein